MKMRITIAKKLWLGFGLVILLLILSSGIMVVSLSRLSSLQQDINVRSGQAVVAMEAAGMGAKMYRVTSDAIVNRNLEQVQKNWQTVRDETLDDFKNVGHMASRAEQKKAVQESTDALHGMISLFEEQLIPLLRTSSNSMTTDIQAMDAKMDDFVSTMTDRMTDVANSLDQENRQANDDFDRIQSKTSGFVMLVCGITLIFAIGIPWIIARGIVRPVRAMANAMDRVVDGDLTVWVDVAGRDEIGQMAGKFSGMLESLRDVIRNIQNASLQVSSSSEELASSSQSLANAATEQAASLEETSAAIEQLGSSIEQNSMNSSRANDATLSAVQDGHQGGDAVEKTVEAMKQIASRISIINDIADQTNLLALNAAIEAARAGEMGKGFAVVAVEVRKLAERSQLAAKEINELASVSVKGAEDAGTRIRKVLASIQESSQLVQEITAACEEQNNGSEQIRTAVSQLDQVTQQNSGASEEISASSEELASQAHALQELVSRFQIG